jgi:hypothetical protein
LGVDFFCNIVIDSFIAYISILAHHSEGRS